MDTFSGIIELWPSSVDLASKIGVEADAVRKWKARNSIPPEYWESLIVAASQAGHSEITADHLTAIAAKVA